MTYATATAHQQSEAGVIRCDAATATGDRCRRRLVVFLTAEPRYCWQHRGRSLPPACTCPAKRVNPLHAHECPARPRWAECKWCRDGQQVICGHGYPRTYSPGQQATP